MMIFYCDRCRGIINNPLSNSNSIEVHQVTQLRFDLCDNCMKKLKEWLRPLIDEGVPEAI